MKLKVMLNEKEIDLEKTKMYQTENGLRQREWAIKRAGKLPEKSFSAIGPYDRIARLEESFKSSYSGVNSVEIHFVDGSSQTVFEK